MTVLIPYALIIVGPFVSFWLGWFGRGVWDKAGQHAERLAQLPQRRRKGPVTDEEWDQIVDTIRGDK